MTAIHKQAIDQIKSILQDVPELNMNNYTEDQVVLQNNAIIEIWEIIDNI